MLYEYQIPIVNPLFSRRFYGRTPKQIEDAIPCLQYELLQIRRPDETDDTLLHNPDFLPISHVQRGILYFSLGSVLERPEGEPFFNEIPITKEFSVMMNYESANLLPLYVHNPLRIGELYLIPA
jgi:hypothetical protein